MNIDYVMTIDSAKSLENVHTFFRIHSEKYLEIKQKNSFEITDLRNMHIRSSLINAKTPYFILPFTHENFEGNENVIMVYLLDKPLYINGEIPLYLIIDLIGKNDAEYFKLLKKILYLFSDNHRFKKILNCNSEDDLELIFKKNIEEDQCVSI